MILPVANATITPGPPAHQVHVGDPVTLHCSVQVGSAPVTFTWLHNGQELARGPVLELGDVDVGHSGTYQCMATNQLGQDGHRVFRALSPELALEVTPQGLEQSSGHRVPVANATITPGPPAHQVHVGDPVTLHCSVQVGSAPVTFTWLHNGQELARGPVLELGDVDVGHSGTYQCMATNQLGQDGHRVFRALSPELALEVTPQGLEQR
ncbi:hypothetical protein HGM15179_021772 [Zosterops borbonicus]|uniref:Ig-like domain-containing protein n=1 Tax=Zosterops borbonicus TaxID=364589 RepID=A0A8K1D661_9PASS|nr:hypothetical protein HGM15179_021772 [Zosterops borbonicus]